MSKDSFNRLDYVGLDYAGLDSPICPSCGEEVSDIHNGGDPRAWWSACNIPDGHLRHQCDSCGEWFRIYVCWAPSFTVTPRPQDKECDDEDFNSLDCA